MLVWIKRSIAVVVVLLAFVVGSIWMFFGAPFFEERRQELAERVFSLKLERPVSVDGHVQLRLADTLQLLLFDVSIPHSERKEMRLATADRLELDINLRALSKGQLVFDDVKVDALNLSLLTFQDGTTNWARPSGDEQDEPSSEENVKSLSDADQPGPFQRVRVALNNSVLTIDNQNTGFEFAVALDEAMFQRTDDGGIETLLATGSVNGEPLEISTSYKGADISNTHIRIGDIDLELATEAKAAASDAAIRGSLNSEITEIDDLFRVLKLEKTLNARAALEVEFKSLGSNVSIDRFEASLVEDGGAEYRASGSVEDAMNLKGISAEFDVSLFAGDEQPSKAATLRDIKITGFGLEVEGSMEELDLKSLAIQTNAFEQGLGEIGQVALNRIYRTPDGKLTITELEVQAGPEETPILEARGSIGDILAFQEIDLAGTLNVAPGIFLKKFEVDALESFGRVMGDFSLFDDGSGNIISRIDAKAVETDLWSLSATGVSEDLGDFGRSSLSLQLGIEDTDRFLEAIGAIPVSSEGLGLELNLTGKEQLIQSNILISAGTTKLDTTLNVDLKDKGLVARGDIASDKVNVSDLRDAAAFFTSARKSRTVTPVEREVQPLVLPDDRVVQPLVLSDDRVVQPLVLGATSDSPQVEQQYPETSVALGQYLSPDRLAARTDIDVQIDIAQIEGAEGVSKLNSELIVREGKLSFGPLIVAYGGGYFNFEAVMDILATPELITVRGATGGWNLGRIMSSIGTDIGAQGILKGRYNLTGSSTSVDSFLKTMVGKVTVSMGQGRIHTSLLELAGLGVVPWLFSEDRRRGYSEIVCIETAVKINHGKVTVDQFVLETSDVQLVASGTLNIPEDEVSIRAEPRPVGRPLARSAVPVDISGKLSDPNIKVHIAGERANRSGRSSLTENVRQPCKPDIAQVQ